MRRLEIATHDRPAQNSIGFLNDHRLAPTNASDHQCLEHIGLVINIARKFAPPGSADFDEYVQVGFEAVVQELPNFDPARGKPSTFFGMAITGAIRREIRRNHGLPQGRESRAREFFACQNYLTQIHGRSVSWAEVAAYLEITEAEIFKVLNRQTAVTGAVPIDQTINPNSSDSSETFANYVPDPAPPVCEQLAEHATWQLVLNRLDPISRQIVIWYQDEERSFQDIANSLGMLREIVRRRYWRAAHKLLKHLQTMDDRYSAPGNHN